jgi:DNA-binding MarR family transcriptional regulator
MSETRWLTREEQRTWRTFMLATNMLFDQFDRELRQEAGIPTTYYEVLVRLSEAPGRRLRMSQLAERSQSSRSHLSHTISRLEDAGWVERQTCRTDRRGAFAFLTDAGFAALEAAAPVHVESVRRHLFDQLDQNQLGQLRQIGERILQHLIPVQGKPTESSLLGDLAPFASSAGPDEEALAEAGAHAPDGNGTGS